VGLVALLGICYLFLTPASINGDGIGYLKQISQGGALVPGHLAYLPLLRLVSGHGSSATLIDLALPIRLFSSICALGAMGLLYAACRRLHGAREALFAAALLGFSQAFFGAAVQVEVYAPSALVVTAILWALVRHADRTSSSGSLRAACAGLAGALAGAAVSLHLTLALLCPSILIIVARNAPPRRRQLHLGISALMMATVGGGLLAVWLLQAGKTAPAEAWSWLLSSDHGVPYPHSWRTPLVVLWGLSRSLVHAPYPYEAPLWQVGLQTALGAAAWIGLGALHLRHAAPRRPAPADRTFLFLWSAPLVLFAAAFYPSDTERWIFIMPAVALFMAPSAGRAAWGLLAAVLLINVFVGQLPATLDRRPSERAAAAERLMPPHALLISPGHGWAEQVGLGTTKPIRRSPLIYHAGAERSLDRAVARMHVEVQRTRARGSDVFVARLRDPDDPRGFKELRWFGLNPAGFAGLFAAYAPSPTGVDGLWRLSRPLPSRGQIKQARSR